jgi:hypothetical protein
VVVGSVYLVKGQAELVLLVHLGREVLVAETVALGVVEFMEVELEEILAFPHQESAQSA